MTVEVDVDGKPRSGASVIEVRLEKQPRFMPEVPPVATEVAGDAVFVDLGKGKNVIALLASGPNADNVDYPKYVVSTHFNLAGADNDLVKYPKLQGSWELPEAQLPTLITFTDINGPTTARVVQVDEFEAVFGPGIRFKRVSVEMVPAGIWPFDALGWPSAFAGEPVSRGIEQKLPWWNGPFPWLKPLGSNGAYVDTRQGAFKWHKGHLKRDF
jgi:hypothetical protein